MPYPTIEAYPYIKLELGSQSVTFDQFSDYSRDLLQGAKIDYSFSGNAIIKRVPHQAKHLWNVTAIASWEQRNAFLSVIQSGDRNISIPPFTNYKITLDDVHLSIIEPTVSRPKADIYQFVGNGYIEYFAKFSVGIDTSTVKETPLGQWVEINFIMNELEKLII